MPCQVIGSMRRNDLANLPGRFPFNLMHDVVKSDVAI